MFKNQELVLYQYLDNFNRKKLKAYYKHLEQVANTFFKKKYTKDGKLSIIRAHWIVKFLEKYLQYIVWKQKSLAIKRKNAYKLEIFQTYFKDYYIVKTKKGIYNENIYNSDKMWFWVRVGKD